MHKLVAINICKRLCLRGIYAMPVKASSHWLDGTYEIKVNHGFDHGFVEELITKIEAFGLRWFDNYIPGVKDTAEYAAFYIL